ncbi:MAG: TatD family hydrolase, partial [Saezia sp.]
HLDAPEFDIDRAQVIERARSAGVRWMVIPAVAPAHFDAVIALAHQEKQPYALGIHPLWMQKNLRQEESQKHGQQWVEQLALVLEQQQDDPYLVAVGEIGLDYFVPDLNHERQWFLYTEQLKLARRFNLPVILHVRHSADMLLKGLRQVAGVKGIAHAFNGSDQQAKQFIDLGFKLGFGGAATFERAQQIRHLLKTVPIESIVLETDAPDMPPHWVYKTAEQRAQGEPQGRNEPAQLAKIAQDVALLRGMSVEELSSVTIANSLQALPKLKQFLITKS